MKGDGRESSNYLGNFDFEMMEIFGFVHKDTVRVREFCRSHMRDTISTTNGQQGGECCEALLFCALVGFRENHEQLVGGAKNV